MKLSLIGMSNSGKSYLSAKLQQEGFHLIDCDQLIAQRLRLADIGDVATWMGQPYEAPYPNRSDTYLQLETETMMTILDRLEKTADNENLVVDTTGSVIYTGEAILKRLKEQTTVVYLDTPDPIKEEMFHSYIRNPKPVIWGELYHKQPQETDEEALARCYPQLLDYRVGMYRKTADITLDYFWLRHPQWTIKDILSRIN